MGFRARVKRELELGDAGVRVKRDTDCSRPKSKTLLGLFLGSIAFAV